MKTQNYEKEYFEKNWQNSYLSQRDNPTYQKKVKEIISLGFNKGKILDIGCAYGFLLREFDKKGFFTYGIDISSFALKKAEKFSNAKLFKIDISKEKTPFKNNFFDIITSIFSLEHVENYSQMLRECFRVLKKHGLLYILIPIKKRWLDDKYHVNYFTKESLIYSLKKNHLSVFKIGEEGGIFQNPFGFIRLIFNGNTNYNFVPKGTGCYLSCFSLKGEKK